MAYNNGLAKTGYSDALRLKTKAAVGITSEGTIAKTGETVAGTRNIAINYAAAGNSLNDNNKLIGFFLELIDGTTLDSNTNTATVTWEV